MYSPYQIVQKTFEQYECTLLTTEEEYKLRNKNQPKYNYIASCGHNHIVFYNVFKSRQTGVLCPSCMTIKNGKIAKERVKDDKLLYFKQELDCINYFKELISEEYTVIKAFDGCKADIIVKPKHILENKWLGIQVKTCSKALKGHNFIIVNKDYTNNMILCICLEDKKMWGFLQENIQGLSKIAIGLNKSKYDKYELNSQNIIEILNKNYELMANEFDIVNLPINIYQQREQEYYRYRESKIDFLTFTYNDMKGLVFDFKIGDLKIQEKIGGLLKCRNNTYLFNLCKNNGKTEDKKHNLVQYNKGDNDFYWLNCSDKKHFYVIPENALIENGYIDNEKKKILIKINTMSTNDLWYNEYLFDYDNVDKERLKSLLIKA
jgi:hypothetical protein